MSDAEAAHHTTRDGLPVRRVLVNVEMPKERPIRGVVTVWKPDEAPPRKVLVNVEELDVPQP
jgi:hypothetical protein